MAYQPEITTAFYDPGCKASFHHLAVGHRLAEGFPQASPYIRLAIVLLLIGRRVRKLDSKIDDEISNELGSLGLMNGGNYERHCSQHQESIT
jgi:hypothetical protein